MQTQANKLREKGYSLKKIADELGISKSAAHRLLERPKVDLARPKVDLARPNVDLERPKVDLARPKVDLERPVQYAYDFELEMAKKRLDLEEEKLRIQSEDLAMKKKKIANQELIEEGKEIIDDALIELYDYVEETKINLGILRDILECLKIGYSKIKEGDCPDFLPFSKLAKKLIGTIEDEMEYKEYRDDDEYVYTDKILSEYIIKKMDNYLEDDDE